MKAYVITIENHDKSEAAAHRCIKSGLKNGIKIETVKIGEFISASSSFL